MMQARDAVDVVMTGLVQEDASLPPLGLQSVQPAATNLAQGSELLEACLEHIKHELDTRGIHHDRVNSVLHAVRYHEALKTASVCYKSCP
jgi:hypothetical protein